MRPCEIAPESSTPIDTCENLLLPSFHLVVYLPRFRLALSSDARRRAPRDDRLRRVTERKIIVSLAERYSREESAATDCATEIVEEGKIFFFFFTTSDDLRAGEITR